MDIDSRVPLDLQCVLHCAFYPAVFSGLAIDIKIWRFSPNGKIFVKVTNENFALVKDTLRSSRVPQVIEFWDELPYNETGKLLRRKVKAALGGEAS